MGDKTVMNTSSLWPPGFGEGVWFNVKGPIDLADVNGRLVILDFWTSCCINCIHTLATLARIESAFPEDVLIIGVHTPKFDAELSSNKVAAAIERFGVSHPVLHDPERKVWDFYGVRAWPTLIFIHPSGRVVDEVVGEPNGDRLFVAVEQMITGISHNSERQRTSPSTSSAREHAGRFRFPAKLKRFEAPEGTCWLLADSGHNQVVEFSFDGSKERRFGSGDMGFQDGGSDSASFNSPQGLAATATEIYVADTGNHALRSINRQTGTVTTVAGTGLRGMSLGKPGPGISTALASPWDLAITRQALLFANAGTHQLGHFDFSSRSVARLAGTGAEGIEDGPAASATLAQPSGLDISSDGSKLYFTDSETSALRVLTLVGSSQVTTLVGSGLFDFGHRNGPLNFASLQHPLGVASEGDTIAIADTFNDVVRVVNLRTGVVNDLDQGDYLCEDSLCIPLSEPAGVAFNGPERLLVVDTNNHRILCYNMTQKVYSTWLV
jgi:thiol-disulfide isomerase/thioredoxin/DNA-binding beta-propeller fold protein YncE